MRKLIEVTQDNIIECDFCNFFIPYNESNKDSDGLEYLNVPCPKCSGNLLTYDDYLFDKEYMKKIKFINKYFSWITIFFPKSIYRKFAEIKQNTLTIFTYNKKTE